MPNYNPYPDLLTEEDRLAMVELRKVQEKRIQRLNESYDHHPIYPQRKGWALILWYALLALLALTLAFYLHVDLIGV
jgi:hypothetical protein